MIGAFSQKLFDVERKLTDQQKQLNDLRSKVVNSFVSDDEIETGQPSLKSMLLRFQASIKEQAFMHNELRSKVAFLTTEIQQLRTEMFQMRSHESCAVPGASGGWRYDPTVPEFQPRQIMVDSANKILLQAGVPLSSRAEAEQQCRQVVEMSRQAGLDSRLVAKATQERQNALMGLSTNDTSASHFHQQAKDELLQELLKKQEELAHKEREMLSKQEWYEHKMRLLKQDKRRRGETIGKLLRSIDEMRETGRLETSSRPSSPSIQSARSVIGRVLETCDLSAHDRIQAVIDIADSEKTMQFRDTPTLTQLIDEAMMKETQVQGQNNNNCQDELDPLDSDDTDDA